MRLWSVRTDADSANRRKQRSWITTTTCDSRPRSTARTSPAGSQSRRSSITSSRSADRFHGRVRAAGSRRRVIADTSTTPLGEGSRAGPVSIRRRKEVARPPTGQIIERRRKGGVSYGIRFRAYGERRYKTTEATTRSEAERELRHVLSDVERGIWRPPTPAPVVELRAEPTFHEFASEWIAARELEGLAEKTLVDLRWSLSNHLLRHFCGPSAVGDHGAGGRSLQGREGPGASTAR